MKGQVIKHAVPEGAMFWQNDLGRRPTRKLAVRRNGQAIKERTYHVVSRMGCTHDLGVFNNSVDSVERALLERYFLVKVGDEYLPPLKTVRRDWEAEHLREFRRHVVREVKSRATIVTLRDVVECYSGAKRKLYENALRSLQRINLHRKDAKLRPFTKFEKQCLLKAARIINPRSPRYNLTLGKYLKKAEKLYFAAINEAWGSVTNHTVIKGMNVFESASVLRAKWCRFRNPVGLGLDATKFDMHVSVEALRYEHSHYNGVFCVDELRRLLTWQLHNGGTAHCPDGEVEFTMPGTRASGDLNTSLGNCILMCALLWALCKLLGVTAELANNGDDCVLILESSDLAVVLAAVPGFFRRYGFRMTVEEPVYEFEQIEFCQSRPVDLPGGWCMVRNVRTCLKKDPICLVPVQNDKVWRKWLGAVGECGLASVPGCPVLQSFYSAFVRSGARAGGRFKSAIFRNTGTMERQSGLVARVEEITPEARASFAAAFGITPDYQIALEEYYDGFQIEGMNSFDVQEGIVELSPPAFIRHL